MNLCHNCNHSMGLHTKDGYCVYKHFNNDPEECKCIIKKELEK